jgi:glycosyltransferase involved in cell wall biosynthesis
MSLSGYIPCYNNEACIAQAIRSMQTQELVVEDLMVVDDGSTDRSAEIARSLGARVIELGRNFGRGAVNARAIMEAKNDLVACLGATNILPPDFSLKAAPWFENESVAAVYGRVVSPPKQGVVGRWRSRHLFRENHPAELQHHAPLITTGSVMRRSAVIAVGNFNAALIHSEDAELGGRLVAAGRDIIADPALTVVAARVNTLGEVLERYWRWNAGRGEPMTVRNYLRQTAFSIRTMARADLAAGDPLGIPISLLSPHYQFWKSHRRGRA